MLHLIWLPGQLHGCCHWSCHRTAASGKGKPKAGRATEPCAMRGWCQEAGPRPGTAQCHPHQHRLGLAGIFTAAFFTFPIIFTVKPSCVRLSQGFVHKLPAAQSIMERAPAATFPRDAACLGSGQGWPQEGQGQGQPGRAPKGCLGSSAPTVARREDTKTVCQDTCCPVPGTARHMAKGCICLQKFF